MSDETNPSLDPIAADRCMNLPRQASPWLNEEIGQRMHARMHWMAQPPQRWANWQPDWGGWHSHQVLKDVLQQVNGRRKVQTFVAGQVDEIKPESWLRSAWRTLSGGDAHWRPTDSPLDMVWANMVLHMQGQPVQLLERWLSMLRVGGMVMFSALGPDTLRELRAVYAQIGWPEPSHLFTDMHDWGDMLVQTGFADPVMDMETLTITYANLDKLLVDLRECGRNLNVHRTPHCLGRGWYGRFRDVLERDLPRDSQGNYVLTAEIVYGHALKPEPTVRVQAQTSVPLADMQRMLRQPRVNGQ